MNKLLFVLILSLWSCQTQRAVSSKIAFTSDLEDFQNLSNFKKALKNVEIIALGENTHGLGDVFSTKVELVKFLHEELGFDLLIFESGYGDAELAWQNLDSLTTREYTKIFSSNFYYQTEEIENLAHYVKSQNKKLKIKGFDCQPQQNYLVKRMSEIVHPIDSTFAVTVIEEMSQFNNLYHYEQEKDSINFYKQRNQFATFLSDYLSFLNKNETAISESGGKQEEVSAIKKSIQIFNDTYSEIPFGSLMTWPASADVRDEAMFKNVKWIKEQHPKSKIIIWAQNTHIENSPKPGYTVKWMGHYLKEIYGQKYYSIGTMVYSGRDLYANGVFDFEHDNEDFLAYHLNQLAPEQYLIDLRKYEANGFLTQLHLGMENYGNTAEFIAKDRFDGLLFLRYSDAPKLIGD